MNWSRTVITCGVILSLFTGCENLIEYSPYQAGTSNLPEKLNEKVITRLENKTNKTFQSFRFAIIGDNHTHYDDFKDQVEALNNTDSIDFVIHTGDITLSGIYREFVWFHDIVSQLRHPLLTTIGNHDFLSNGDLVFEEMFGSSNFTLDYNNCRFVFFDDIIWEKNMEDPDFEWLSRALKTEETVSHVFLISHIPPWSNPFSLGNRLLFYQILEKQNVTLSIHGHTHSYFYGNQEECTVPFLTSGDSTDREILTLDIRQDTVIVNRNTF